MVLYLKLLIPKIPIKKYLQGWVDHRKNKKNIKKLYRGRRNKNSRKTKKKFSSLDEDFNFGLEGSDILQDFYGGKQRFRSCQKRMLRVNFKDLNWQVSLTTNGLGLNPTSY